MPEGLNEKIREVEGSSVTRTTKTGWRSGKQFGLLRATNFVGFCFTNQERVTDITKPWVCPPELE
jgi:hypothetical protein